MTPVRALGEVLRQFGSAAAQEKLRSACKAQGPRGLRAICNRRLRKHHWVGSTRVGLIDFTLLVSGGVPSTLGLFFYETGQTSQTLGDGLRCVDAGGSALFRLMPATPADFFGIATRQVDFSQAPAGSGPGQITPASTWSNKAKA